MKTSIRVLVALIWLVLDHATSEIAIGTTPGVDARKKLPGEGFKRAWDALPPGEQGMVDNYSGGWGSGLEKPRLQIERI